MADKGKGNEKPKKAMNLVYENYTIASDKLERKNKSCPKCGPAVFLANHKNRKTCGACGYTEMVSGEVKKEEEKNSE